MIADRIDRWSRYFDAPAWRAAFEYLATLDATAEEGFTELDGRNLYARVMSYETKHEAGAVLESHREYIDIQSALEGPERIAWYPLEGLEPLGPYNEAKDVLHYRHPAYASGQMIVEPGHFIGLFPTDGHMPQLAAGPPRLIKKVVIKVRVSAVAGLGANR